MPHSARAAALLLLLAAGAAHAATEISDLDAVCTLRWVSRASTPSRKCLACHDGSMARSAIYTPALGERSSHPVEIDYARAARRNRARLKPPNRLPASLPLVDGKVACTTCHDGASKHPGRTALPPDGSAFCLACHDT